MIRFKMRISGAIPNGKKGQEFFYSFVFILSILALPGCVTSQKPAPYAPTPPIVDHNFIDAADYSAHAMQFFPNLHSSADLIPGLQPGAGDVEISAKANSLAYDSQINCRLKDRFDREALVAYEWNRNRMSFDVDGIGGRSGSSGMKLEYKVRLQPEKSQKQKCRYNARWQGVLGSSYNEFVLRDKDTIWSELHQKRVEALEHLSSVF